MCAVWVLRGACSPRQVRSVIALKIWRGDSPPVSPIKCPPSRTALTHPHHGFQANLAHDCPEGHVTISLLFWTQYAIGAGHMLTGTATHSQAHSLGYGGEGKSTELQVKAARVTEAMKGPR